MAQPRTKAPASKKSSTPTTKRPAKGAATSTSKRPSHGASTRPGAKGSAAKGSTAKGGAAKGGAAKGTAAKGAKGAAKGAAPTAKKAPRKKPVAAAPTPVVVDRATQRREGARELAKWVAAAGIDRKAERIEIIDVGDKIDYADYLVLMSGRSDRQVRSIAEGVAESLRERGVRATSIEGLAQGHWVLVDFSDVIVHVFLEEARSYYDIESLWMDARRVPVEGAVLPPVPKPDGPAGA